MNVLDLLCTYNSIVYKKKAGFYGILVVERSKFKAHYLSIWLWFFCYCTAPRYFFHLQSIAVLREFDFLEDQEVSRSGPLIIPAASVPTTPILAPEQLVPPSPQPLVEFPDDEVYHFLVVWLFHVISFSNLCFSGKIYT